MSGENTVEPVLKLRDLTKDFGANQVLKGVTLELRPGRIAALLGANGAGKSTLIKILSGVYQPTGGEIEMDGEVVTFETPMDSNRAGVRTVHQRIDDAIVPGLTVAENLLFEQIAMNEIAPVSTLSSLLPRAKAIADVLDLGWDDHFLRKDAYNLGIADCQMLLLARALADKPKVLILDEPTSTLSEAESERLFEVVRRMRDQGVAILYVSHRMAEIKALADDVAVLRDGKIVDRQDAPFNLDEAVSAMLGQGITTEIHELVELTGTDVVLEIEDHQIFDYSPPVSLQAKAGEVTAIIGLVGAGKTELLEAVFGDRKSKTGSMAVNGRPYDPTHPGAAISRGVYMVPEDRARQSMMPKWSVEWTYTLPFIRRFAHHLTLDRKKEWKRTEKAIQDFGVVCEGPMQPVDALSGGNQQKVIVARWMQEPGTILILDEPFRGVDIGARREIGRRARLAAEDGMCVVVAVSDVNEAREVADRIVVLVEGRIALDRRAKAVSDKEIVESMTEDVGNE